ncbi:MAG TPA: sigma-70 family RNA polymerase sigma factor [Nannocystaceae bacterium]|nr:sigma-70 family RNA polymerase sigma factor [Nannocystaceae bacterium]
MGLTALAEPDAPDFGTLYREQFDYVWACLRALGVGASDLDDTVQAVFIVVHRRLGAFDQRASVRTWLFAIAARVAARNRRDYARLRRRVDALAAEPSPESVDLEHELASREVFALLRRFSEGLDEGMRAVFVPWFFESHAPAEIAEQLGLSRNTVFSRLRIIRARLQRACDRIDEHDRATIESAERRARARRRVGIALALGRSSAVRLVGWIGAALVGATIVATAVLPEPPRPAVAELAPRNEPATATPPVAAILPARGAADPSAAPIVVEPRAPPTRPPKRTTAAPPAPIDVQRAVALVQRARAAIGAGRYGDARAALREHADAFAAGPLVLEREAYAAIVSCQLDRDRSLRDAFVRRHADSLWVARVDDGCTKIE